jgi:PAS domain S-box-containing protein
MTSDASWGATVQPAPELIGWRTKVLNVLLLVAAVGSAPVIALDIFEAASVPAERPYAVVYGVLLFIVATLAALRRLPHSLRAWALVLAGYGGAAMMLFKSGLPGNGRLFLIALPVLTAILIGRRAGVVGAAISLCVFVAYGVSAQTGLMASAARIQSSASFLELWVGGGLGFALTLVSIAVLHALSERFLEDLIVCYARLHESSDRLRAFHQSIVEGVEEGILLEDATGIITYVNLAGAEMLGYGGDGLVGQHWSVTVAADAIDQVTRETAKRRRGVSSRYETCLVTRDGREVSAFVSARPLLEDGEFTGVLSVFTDITERLRTESALRASEERLRTVLHNMPVMMVALDEHLKPLAWNQECRRVTGYSAAEIVGNPRALELLYPDATYRKRTMVGSIEGGDRDRVWERQVTCKGGETRWIAWSNVSQRASVPGWSTWGVGIDVTERKRAEDQLRRSGAAARAILDATVESVILIDNQAVIIDLNETAAQRLGRERQDLIGKGLGGLVADGVLTPELAAARWAAIQEVIRSSRPARFEDTRSGIIFDNHYYPVLDDEGTIGQVAIFSRDITDQRRAERQARRADRWATIGRMTGALTHEINNPLQAVRTNLELLADFELDPQEHRRRLRTSLREIERLAGVTHRLLEFSVPRDDNRTFVSVGSLIEDTWALMREQLRRAGIQIVTDVPADVQAVWAARPQLVQVLVNLINNAVEAMPQGGCLRLSARQEGNEVVIEVSDDGRHLTRDELEHAFDPYFTTKSGHSGMGLSISKGIVESHGGRIDATNLDGDRGVAFTFTLPMIKGRKEGTTA